MPKGGILRPGPDDVILKRHIKSVCGPFNVYLRAVAGRLWSVMGHLLRATKPAPVLGFAALPVPFLGLLGAWWPLIKVAACVGLFWFGYSWVWDRGYSARDADYAAAIKAANYEIAKLNSELELERDAKELERGKAASSASVGVPDVPQCVKSECALSADAISRLNKVN